MIEYITPFDKERSFKDVYAPDNVYQLIFKNCISPDGVTIIGTEDSIGNFVDALDESELVSHGFYEWKKARFTTCKCGEEIERPASICPSCGRMVGE